MGDVNSLYDPGSRFWSKVDFSSIMDCWPWAGTASDGYGVFMIKSKYILAHRISYLALVGPISGINLDHKCRNRRCVNPTHLRPATHKQNGENRGLNRNNTSGARGVFWSKQRNRWKGQVVHNGNPVYVGMFKNIKDAEIAVISKRNQLYTHNELDKTTED